MGTRIVVPVDGSAFGKRALPLALALARRNHAAVELVHVQSHCPSRAARRRSTHGWTWKSAQGCSGN